MMSKPVIIALLVSVILTTAMISNNFQEYDREESEIKLISASNPLQPGSYTHGVKFIESMSITPGSYEIDGPLIIPQGITLKVSHGLIELNVGDATIDGAVVCATQNTNGGFGGSAGGNGQPGGGIGGGQGGNPDGGGGGGASYGTLGISGSSGESNGGNRGIIYGFDGLAPGSSIPSSIDIQMGSVGGGGAGGDVSGGKGGAGGGAYFLQSSGIITVSGSITCDGGFGQNGDGDTYNGSGGGGGGSGGGILLYGKEVHISGTLSTDGGNGGSPGSGGILGVDGGQGGNGGLGRIKIFYSDDFTNIGSYAGVTHFEQIIIPQVSITIPKFNQAYQPAEELSLSFVNSNGSYEYAWDSDSFTTVPSTYIPLTPVTEGVHVLHVKVYSNTTTLTEASYTITVDGSAPTVTLLQNSIVIVAGTVGNELTFTANDSHPGLFSVVVNNSLWDENLSWINGENDYSVDGLPLGLHNVSLVLSDTVWNNVTITAWVNVTQDVLVIISTVTETQGENGTIPSTVEITTTETQVSISTEISVFTTTESITDQPSNATNPSVLPLPMFGIIFGLGLTVTFSIISRKRD